MAPFAASVEASGDAVGERVVVDVGDAEEAFRDARDIAHEYARLRRFAQAAMSLS